MSKLEIFEKPKKINYIYVLTPKGIAVKTKLTINFVKRKMIEYDQLKKELKEKIMWVVGKIKQFQLEKNKEQFKERN